MKEVHQELLLDLHDVLQQFRDKDSGKALAFVKELLTSAREALAKYVEGQKNLENRREHKRSRHVERTGSGM